MKIINTDISGLFIIEPKLYHDSRGYFFESYNNDDYSKVLPNINFIQDNESKSTRGVLRGLHFQIPPYEQSKLVRCIIGEVLDVAVDLRKNSKTYGKHFSLVLSEKNKKQLFIPKGFAHGYLVLSDFAIFSYKVDQYYKPDYDSGIVWNDKELNIDWKLKSDEILISKKDQDLLNLNKTKIPFQ